MKKLLILPVLLVSFVFLTATTTKTENSSLTKISISDDIEKGGYYYMTLSCRHVKTNDNYSVVTPVRYYSKKPRVSDLMKWVSINMDYLTYGTGSGRVWGSYKDRSTANRSRADGILSSKRYNFKIRQVNFSGY